MTRNAMFAISAVVVGLSMLNAPEASAQFRGPMVRPPIYRPATMPIYRPMPAPMYRPAPMPTYRPMPAPMYRPMQMPAYRPMQMYRPPIVQPVYRPTPVQTYRPTPSIQYAARPSLQASSLKSIGGALNRANTYYKVGDGVYKWALERQGRGNEYAPIGSTQFFKNNFSRPSWDEFSKMTGGIFVKPKNCWSPYC